MNIHIYLRSCHCGASRDHLVCKLLHPGKWAVVCPTCGSAGETKPNALLAAQAWNAEHPSKTVTIDNASPLTP